MQRSIRSAGVVFVGPVVLALAALAPATACKKDPIEIIDPVDSEGGDFGRADLLAAVTEFRKTPNSGDAYRVFADIVATLRPRFDKNSNALADRMLAFLAIGPLSTNHTLPADEQLASLASTVWPSALGPAPGEGEDGHAYLHRVCEKELASECRFIVPEYRPLLVGAKVWRRFRFRAQETYAYCRPCQSDETYRNTLRRYDELSFPLETLAAERSGEGHPREWPRATNHSMVWDKAVPSLDVARSGSLRISGREVPGKEWRDRLKSAADRDEIGLYLRPDLSVARLREYLRDLGTLGFKAARLQVRLPEYPYELRYYPLSTRVGRGFKLSVRATDTIQVMVLAADQKAGKDDAPPPLLSVF